VLIYSNYFRLNLFSFKYRIFVQWISTLEKKFAKLLKFGKLGIN